MEHEEEKEHGAEGKPRGFGRAFVDLFRELGYDEGELHADMFEWLFGLPSMRIQAFLDWFLTSIRPRQSVKRQLNSKQDYAIYKALLRGTLGGNGELLTGDQLARAELACRSDLVVQHNENDESMETLDAANATLEQEIHAMESKLRLANERNDRLAKMVQRRTLQVDRQTQRVQRQHDKDHFNELLAQIVPANRQKVAQKAPPRLEDVVTKIQRTLRHLATPVGNVDSDYSSGNHAIHSAPHPVPSSSSSLVVSSTASHSNAVSLCGDERGRPWRNFLYQHSMETLESIEQRNIRTLQARIPAIAALTASVSSHSLGEEEASDVSMSPGPTFRRRGGGHENQDHQQMPPPPSPWLHESDPVQLNMREQDVMLYNKCCVELERLRRAFVVGERDALLAQLQVTRHESHLKQLTSSRRQLLQQFQLMSQDAIWARKQILSASLEKTKHQLSDLFQRTFPEKLDELAFLKSTSILLKSYEQKLWRQEHRFIRLRLLLEGFEMQNARLRLAHRLLDAERQDLLRIHAIFQQLVVSLQQLNHRTEQRIKSYDTTTGSDVARNTISQTYLNEQDDLAHRLFEILERVVHGNEHSRDQDIQLNAGHTHRLRTFDALVRLAELKLSDEQTVRDSLHQIQTEWQRLFASKRYTLNQLRTELFGDATSSTPMLLPAAVATGLHEASAAKDACETALETALETLRLHKRSVQVDVSKRMQQEQDVKRLTQELSIR